MVADTAEAYAGALLAVGEAEGNLDRLESGLFAASRALEGNTELRERLTDPGVDLSTKLEILDELLGGRPETAAALMWVVQAGRGREITAIADSFVRQAAARRGSSVAEVRTAHPLSDEQQRRLAESLSAQAGQPVELKVVVDPDVVGGIVVKMGDTVIDGSVARRLSELRAAMVGA